MPMRQQFVVQLGITEVQWNQSLLVIPVFFLTGCRTNVYDFAAKKAIRRGDRSQRQPRRS